MRGIFEIHITVDHRLSNAFILMAQFSSDRGFKQVFAAATQAPPTSTQLMLSAFATKATSSSAAEHAEAIAEDMRRVGLVVLRVKVEAHYDNCQGVPEEDPEGAASLAPVTAPHTCYFEYHTKAGKGAYDASLLPALENDLAEVKGADPRVFTAASVNLYGSGAPLLTVRVYGCGKRTARAHFDRIVKALCVKGYREPLKVHNEYSVYDTNPALDCGWLLPGA